jgi:hypothetical protein
LITTDLKLICSRLSDGRLLPTLLDLRLPTPGIFSSADKMSSPFSPTAEFLSEMEQDLL